MKTNNLFANVAGKALALAAAMMMSIAFTACSNDDDKPAPQPQPTFTNTVTIDGNTMHVLSVSYRDQGNGNFQFFLNLAEREFVELNGNTSVHIAKDIDLTKKESKHGLEYWSVGYFLDSNVIVGYAFTGSGNPENSDPVFTTGTLRMDGNPLGGEFSVSLKNGKINMQGEEYTISVSWKGKAKKVN